MKLLPYLMILSTFGLVACEQALVHGPVGGATVAVNELRSGAEVVNNLVTASEDSIIADDGQAAYDSYNDLKKLRKLGKHKFSSDLTFDDDTWYVMSAAGGFDYDPDADAIVDGPTQVNGTVHVVLKGSQLNASGLAISPLTESAYQFIKDYVSLLDDNEIQAALDAMAADLVGDVNNDGDINYTDVISRNPLFNLDALLPAKAAGLDSLADALRDGDNDATLQSLANALYDSNSPQGVPEAVYADSISDIIVNAGCGPGCHYAPGIATTGPLASDNELVPPTNPDYVALNTANFTMLVNTNSVSYVVGKPSNQIQHTGLERLPQGSPELAAFEAWLNLL